MISFETYIKNTGISDTVEHRKIWNDCKKIVVDIAVSMSLGCKAFATANLIREAVEEGVETISVALVPSITEGEEDYE